jgi:arsenite methyltransferase
MRSEPTAKIICGEIMLTLENSQNYYGDVLTGSADLKTDACTMADAPPPAVRLALSNVHQEVKSRYYGCGLVAPEAIKGCHILDLGSGAGQDAYALAQLVGDEGSVTGVHLPLV